MNNRRFQSVIGGGKLVLVDFYTDWCVPCQQVMPILKKLKSEFREAVRIIKVDADKNPFIAAKYHIKNVPTLVLFKDGIPIWTGQGVIPHFQLREVLSTNV